jgi:hypothetical protein
MEEAAGLKEFPDAIKVHYYQLIIFYIVITRKVKNEKEILREHNG